MTREQAKEARELLAQIEALEARISELRQTTIIRLSCEPSSHREQLITTIGVQENSEHPYAVPAKAFIESVVLGLCSQVYRLQAKLGEM